MFVHRHAESFNDHTPKTALMEAYQHRFDTPKHSRQFFDTTMLWIRYLRALLAEHQWSSSLAMDFDVQLSYQASYKITYQSLVSEFAPKKQGIFGSDRVQDPGLKHYSNIATCVRALIPLSSTGIPALDHSLLGLLGLYYGSLHGDAGLKQLAYSSYASALGEYSRLIDRVLDKNTNKASRSYHTFIYISISMQMFEYVSGITAQSGGTDNHLHMRGALKALQYCGPEPLQKYFGMQKAFRGLRGAAIFDAIEQRKETFLGRSEWLGIPPADEKSMRDRLNDVGVFIPEVLERFDKLPSNFTAETFESGSSLLARITELQSKLEGWLSMFQGTTSEPLYWSRNSSSMSANEQYDPECAPKYSNHFHQTAFLCGPVAGLLVLHWSFALHLSMTSIELQKNLLSYVRGVQEKLGSRDTLSSGLEREKALAESTAQLILEAEPYLSSCYEGLICLQAPLRTVAKYFDSLS
jgi:hypothetical protein